MSTIEQTFTEQLRDMQSYQVSAEHLMTDDNAKHPYSKSCWGEQCSVCGNPATHKIGQEFLLGEPCWKHNLTAYVCCEHFCMVLGPSACAINAVGMPSAEELAASRAEKGEA